MTKRFRKHYVEPLGALIDQPAIGVLFAAGTTVPTDATGGYAPGCFFIDTDASAGAQVWVNQSTLASCLFRRLDCGYAGRLVASGAALTVTQALHDGKTIVLAAAAAITLPAMSGSGARYRFVLPQDATAVTITATGAHLFGALNQNNDTAQGTGFQLPAINAGGSTIITLDGTTKGGRKGDWVVIEDVASSVGLIYGQTNASGSEASPFS